ncbi:MAG: leucine-rich repeat protein [Prolixibacteraceae bacterium]|nr:leucine-rich repeat protein [Prolixibacteraceae bacterium]
MKLKIKFLLLFLLCSISNITLAQSVNINTAKKVARNHLESIAGQKLKSAIRSENTINFTSIITEVSNQDTLYYILNDTINKGFVIVSADRRAWPILAYSKTGCFNEKEQPKAFTYWMDNRKKEIEYIITNNIQPDVATIASWKNLTLKSSVIGTASLEPLIKTQWDQGCYYNFKCPADAVGECGHVYTGCTATAMAQIMKYWNFPTKGNGSHSYYHHTYGTLSADFGSTNYQWDQMPDKITSPNDAIATLMYHLGISVEMDYGPTGSAAYFSKYALEKYFGYSPNAIVVDRALFSTNDWANMLKSELNSGRPIYYYGGDSLVGHSFICDGYQGEDYFHFNWGWSGSSDGYFYLGTMTPGLFNFNDNQYIVMNILPGDLPKDYKGLFLSSNNLDAATKGETTSVDVCSSSNWTALSDQSWITLSTNSGDAGKSNLTLTVTENQSGSDRSATVTISAVGYRNQIITINQRIAVNLTPNGLYNSISKNAVSIQKLKLTGSIDARDFRTMRDAMPALTEVDLSEVTIVAYTGMDGPVTYNNWVYPANTIPDDAFTRAPCRHDDVLLKKIILPETTTSIGNLAFGYCKYLTTVNISSKVTHIGDRAFGSCNAFINVEANNPNYSSIDGVLFNKEQSEIIVCPKSKTGNYTIPSSVTNIIRFAFMECTNLTSVIIPSSVTTIGKMAFQDCNGLTSIGIPSSVRSMDGAFFKCSALINVDPNNPNYSSIDGVLFNKAQSKLIQCPTSKTGIYNIPSQATSIGDNAFSYCTALTNVTIPSTVNSIGYGAFLSTGLTTITIPESVTVIEPVSFFQCNKLTSVSIPSSVISIGSDAFSMCGKLVSIYSYSIHPVDLNLSATFFRSVNKAICTLYVPFGSKDAYGAANQWKDFNNIVEMPGIFLSNKRIGMGPNESTTPVVISSSSNWSAQTDKKWLTINPTSGMAGRDTIYFATSAISSIASRTATVTLSATGLDLQKITVTQYGIIEISSGNLKTLMAGQLSGITSLTLSGTIDARDFKTMRDDMPVLASIDLSDVTITKYSGTEGTAGNDVIDYSANVVPEGALNGKTCLTSITLPKSVTSIAYWAFKDCKGLFAIIIPTHTISIEHQAFLNCTGLKSITIPSSVMSIRNESFHNCSALFYVDSNNSHYSSIDGILFNKTQTELLKYPASKTGDFIIPSSVTSIGSYSFYCSTLKNITIPSSVVFIGNSAFGYCRELTTVTIPYSVTTIGELAFMDCNNLRTIYAYPAKPVNLSSSPAVFINFDHDKCTLYVLSGSKVAYRQADQWKDFKYIVELPNQIPLANAGNNLKVDENNVFSLDGTASFDPEGSDLAYFWMVPNGFTMNSNTAPKPIFTAPEVSTDTTYTISLIVHDGTNNSPADQVEITVLNKTNTGINDISNSNELQVYPNPTKSFITISMVGLQRINYTVEVYDGIGELKFKEENAYKMDLSSLRNGIYFIKVITRTQSYIEKIIKK